MLVGHLAAGMVAKRAAPGVPLSVAVFAALVPDFIYGALLLTGVEHLELQPGRGAAQYIAAAQIGFSHSLLTDLVWAAILAAAWFAFRRQAREAWLLFAAVLSHWALDFVSNPWSPLTPWGEGHGLAIWASIPTTLIVEGGLWVVAIAIYLRATRPAKRAGIYGFWIVAALVTWIWFSNITGPPPPSQAAAGLGALILFSLIVAWAAWMGRARRPVL